ncbi:MAG: hypothetical protein Fur009_6060 [Candidatus Microgenomates bacterium]
MRTIWDEDIKNRAKALRKKGYSYSQLTKKLKVARSTLHQWVRGVKRPIKFSNLDRIRWIKKIQPMAVKANIKKRQKKIKEIISEVKSEVGKLKINLELKKAILSMLYWAEGTKVRGVLVFANTDPRMILLFITLLRSCYQIDESKLRVRLHLHEYHKEKEVKKFWSELLKIPLTQFLKTYKKQRSKEKTFRQNFGGICFIKYNNVYLKEKIVQYGYALGEKIAGKVDVPVA